MRRIKAAFAALVLLLAAPAAQAAVTPLSVAIIPPVQFPPSDFSVAGVRASVLWGEHRNVYGFDLGVIGNITEQDFAGIAASGIFNITRGSTTVVGLQLAGIANWNVQKVTVIGLQVAAGLNYNLGESSLVGVELALGNFSPHMSLYGFQLGVYNRARSVHGFQIGLINVTEELHGIQIGLINFHQKGLFSVAPILNIGI